MTFLYHHSNQSKACEQQKSSLKEKKTKKKPQPSWATQAHVLCCCRGVMACCTQKDVYEASRLHLFRSASIKLAEALAARGRSRRRRPRNAETRQKPTSRLGDTTKKLAEKTVEKNMCCLDRRANGCGWYICARCVS